LVIVYDLMVDRYLPSCGHFSIFLAVHLNCPRLALRSWAQYARRMVTCSFDDYELDDVPPLRHQCPLYVFPASDLVDHLFPDHLIWMILDLSIYFLAIPQPPIVGPLQQLSH
jgi:hypothetical protein